MFIVSAQNLPRSLILSTLIWQLFRALFTGFATQSWASKYGVAFSWIIRFLWAILAALHQGFVQAFNFLFGWKCSLVHITHDLVLDFSYGAKEVHWLSRTAITYYYQGISASTYWGNEKGLLRSAGSSSGTAPVGSLYAALEDVLGCFAVRQSSHTLLPPYITGKLLGTSPWLVRIGSQSLCCTPAVAHLPLLFLVLWAITRVGTASVCGLQVLPSLNPENTNLLLLQVVQRSPLNFIMMPL